MDCTWCYSCCLPTCGVWVVTLAFGFGFVCRLILGLIYRCFFLISVLFCYERKDTWISILITPNSRIDTTIFPHPQMSFYPYYRAMPLSPSPTSSQKICVLVTNKMRSVFWTHAHISFLLTFLQMMFTSKTSAAALLLSFISFCNLFCLAERIWDLQLESLVYWPPFCQCAFLVSRLLLVTIAVIVSMLWVCIGWTMVLEPCFNGMWLMF